MHALAAAVALDPAAVAAVALAWISTLVTVAAAIMAGFARLQALAANINGVGRRVSDIHDRLTAGGGASAVSPAVLPVWNQLQDPLPDGRADPQASSDCGWECVAEVVMWALGVPLTAGAVRQLVGGWRRPGWSTAADLVRGLELCNVTAVSYAFNFPAARLKIDSVCSSGRPVIALGRWVDPSVQHWVAITRSDAGGIAYNDPYGGQRVYRPWEQVASVLGGELVEPTGLKAKPALVA